ncbi:hypothetical protein RhiirC2_669794, partial [Rhizophagus irregularis]
DMAIALSLDNKIKEGYKFIVNNYNPGDDIWLFGFSHGAYIVRCIAGMIRNCGISIQWKTSRWKPKWRFQS